MIFVTVGTHEQQFNRLIETIDSLKVKGKIRDEVIMQIGFSTFIPKHCKWKTLISYAQMNIYIQKARIVVTHGGPASFIMPLQMGKVPIVVPRQKKYGEHVNDHQVDFCRKIEERIGNIIVVEDVGKIMEVIENYEEYCAGKNANEVNHNKIFNESLEALISKFKL